MLCLFHLTRGIPLGYPNSFNRSLIVAREVKLHHPFPILPIVGPAIPESKGVADTFVPENARHLFIVFAQSVIFADSQNDVLLPQSTEPAIIMFMGNEHGGVMKVEIVVRITISKTADITETTHAQNAADPVGMS